MDSNSDCCRVERHKILDISFYDEDTLSLLLQEDAEDETPLLMQMPLSVLDDGDAFSCIINSETPAINVSTL